MANGWLLPEGQICTVFEKNIRGALAALAAAGVLSTPTSHEKYVRFVEYFNTWNVYGRGNQLPV